MKNLLYFFVVAAIWDALTTFLGTLAMIYGDTSMTYMEMIVYDVNKTFAAFGFAAIIVLFLFSAKAVVSTGVHIMFRLLIAIAFAYDVITSFWGNATFILPGEDITLTQYFIVVGLTLVVSGSSIAIPYLLTED